MKKMYDMTKIDYLRRAFSNMHRKTLENYAITQVWAGVKHLSLYPVTQQYVKRPQNKYALIDLYFPQIKFAVEIDEGFHEKNIDCDTLRMDDIFSSIHDEGNGSITFSRIKEGMYEEVENDISQTINKIKLIAAQHSSLSWDEGWKEKEYEEQFDRIKQNGRLDISDPIGFTRMQVTNDIFGLDFAEGYLKFGKSWFPKKDNTAIWFPHLTPNKKWENSINSDWTEILERRIDGEKAALSKDHNPNILRYTFAKYKNAFGEISYRYIGNFRFKEKNKDVFYYEKYGDFINIPA